MPQCQVTLTLSPGGDMPADGAIYHPTRNSFFVVRQGYISEYSTGLVLVQGPSRFAASINGRSSIAYDSVNDRIWVGTNGDWAAGYLGDVGGANPSKSTAGLYRIIPSSLNVEAFIDVTTIVAVKDFSAITGVGDVLVANGKLFASFGHFTGSGSLTSPAEWLFALNLPAYTLAWSGNAGTTFNNQLAHDSSNQLWMAGDWDKFNDFFPVYGADSALPTNNPNVHPTNAGHCAIAFSTVAGGAIYIVEMTNQQVAKYNFTTGNLISEPTLVGATAGGMTSRIRFNPNDNLLYIPCPAANQVIAFNPNGDTVSHIYTAGLDSPADMVFAPGGINVALQSGPTGVKLLTT